MKHAVKQVHFAGIGGHAGGGPLASRPCAMPQPPVKVREAR